MTTDPRQEDEYRKDPADEWTAAELIKERRAKGLTAADVEKHYPSYAYDPTSYLFEQTEAEPPAQGPFWFRGTAQELEAAIARAIDTHYDEEDYRPVFDAEGAIITSAAARAVLRLLGADVTTGWEHATGDEIVADIKRARDRIREASTERVMTSAAWEKELGDEILDPDGWRDHPYGYHYAWREPITRAEYDARKARSTIQHNPPKDDKLSSSEEG